MIAAAPLFAYARKLGLINISMTRINNNQKFIKLKTGSKRKSHTLIHTPKLEIIFFKKFKMRANLPVTVDKNLQSHYASPAAAAHEVRDFLQVT